MFTAYFQTEHTKILHSIPFFSRLRLKSHSKQAVVIFYANTYSKCMLISDKQICVLMRLSSLIKFICTNVNNNLGNVSHAFRPWSPWGCSQIFQWKFNWVKKHLQN